MKKVKLQVPMDQDVRDGLEKRAHELGFDSAQAYIRVWAKSKIDGRTIDFGEDSWGEPPEHVMARWEKQLEEHERDRKAGKVKSFKDTEEALEYLHEKKQKQ